MLKIKTITIIALSVILIPIIGFAIFCGVCYFDCHSIFSKLQNQTTTELLIFNVDTRTIYINNKSIYKLPYVKKRWDEWLYMWHEPLCVYNNKLFYLKHLVDEPDNKVYGCELITVDLLNGEEELLYHSDRFSRDRRHYQLSTLSEQSNHNGAIIKNGKIYIRTLESVVCYNFQTEQIEYLTNLPENGIRWEISDNYQSIIFCDLKSGEKKEFTLENLINTSGYSIEFEALSERKTFDNVLYTENLFNHVKVIDDEIYIVCKIHNYGGYSFIAVFKYDYESNSAKYVTYFFNGGLSTSDCYEHVVIKEYK